MASEDGAVIVSNVGCDVNNTNQRATEPVGTETVGVASSGTASRTVIEETDSHARDSARNSPRTPTGLPAASPIHANTEGHALRKNTSLASSSGDVARLRASSEPDDETPQPFTQRRSMSRNGTDLEDTARLLGEPDGNRLLCYSLLRETLDKSFQISLLSGPFAILGDVYYSNLTVAKLRISMFNT